MARIDLYTLPHKALRVAVAHGGTILSATDPARLDGDLVVVRSILAELRSHAAHEDEFIHPLLARLVPTVEAELAAQHVELDAGLDDLERTLDDLQGRDVAPDEITALFRAYERVAARNLLHLDHEETVAMPALWTKASSVSLQVLVDRFHAAHPDATEIYRRWPAGLTAAERASVGVTA